MTVVLKPIAVTVHIEADSQDTHNRPELEQLTNAMGDEILELGVSSVKVVPSRPPGTGEKGDFLVELAIAVLPVMLSTLFGYLREWVRRPNNPPVTFSYNAGTVRVTLELSGSGEPDFDISEVVAAVVDVITKGRDAK